MFEPAPSNQGITAVLGPTNTGKTHRAIERMLEHPTGMMGLPLRLLAREVYDRITARIGERHVALVTGEEKRVPSQPRYWICTVEAMPMDREVSFLAVDEIQLGTHRERGHVFTDRLLNARGASETWFLGSETVRRLVERLVPTARICRHPRLSRLHGRQSTGINGLPKRSAVVAFSASRVYELAERIRRRHGGAAIVLGALSPRTRNAQVALYQSGEVDYLVATDAIGMGLNLSISHVAFADVSKFDGRESRPLELAELAQIAGRAGRYLDDGTFGVLSPRPPLPNGVVRALEHHQFPSEHQLYWRNSELDLTSLEALIESLRKPPMRRELRSIEPAEDHRALLALSSKPDVRQRAKDPDLVALLWQVCQIPDYPQLLFELHINLLSEIFVQLTGREQQLNADWLNEQLRRIDRTEGDIETLMGRIAEIRTWNYVTQHTAWVPSSLGLTERARDIEDRLSDALHERLMARFIERRHKPSFALETLRSRSGNKAHPFAQLLGNVISASSPLAEVSSFIDALVAAQHEQLRLDAQGRLHFEQRCVGKLLPGSDLLHPDVQVRLDSDPGQGAVSRVRRRLLAFCRDLVDLLLGALRLPALSELSGPARGLVYQLEQGLGSVRVAECQRQLSDLSSRDRQLLSSVGVKFGRYFVYLRRLLDSAAIEQRLGLATAYFGGVPKLTEPLRERVSVATTAALPAMFPGAVGFAQVGPLLLRVDQFERLISELRGYEHSGAFQAPRDLARRLDCGAEQIPLLLEALGYHEQSDGRWSSERKPRRGRSQRPRGRRPSRAAAAGHSPADDSSSESYSEDVPVAIASPESPTA